MSEWLSKSLGELAEVRVSNVDKRSVDGELSVRLCNYMDVYSSNEVNDYLPYMRATASRAEVRRFGLRDGDVVITKDSESPDDIAVPAYVSDVGDDVVCGYHLAILRPTGLADGKYLSYLLRTEAANRHFARTATGSTRYGLSIRSIKSAPLIIRSSKDEQCRIADLLSAVDELLATSSARLTKLANKRAGFVQQVLLPTATAAEEVPLGAIAPLVTSGSRGWASYYSEEGALFLRIGNLTRLHPNLRLDDVVRVKVPAGGEGARTKLLEGDVLISITADLGIVGCVPSGVGEAYVNQHIALARIADKAMHPRWVAHALASPYGASQIARLNDGGAKAGLNLPTIRALKVPKAAPEQQRNIAAALDALDEQISAEQASIDKLALQKKGLLESLLRPRS